MTKKQLAGYGAIAMSVLTALSVAPYTLETAGVIIPPGWKERIFFASVIAGLILKGVRDHLGEEKK